MLDWLRVHNGLLLLLLVLVLVLLVQLVLLVLLVLLVPLVLLVLLLLVLLVLVVVVVVLLLVLQVELTSHGRSVRGPALWRTWRRCGWTRTRPCSSPPPKTGRGGRGPQPNMPLSPYQTRFTPSQYAVL